MKTAQQIIQDIIEELGEDFESMQQVADALCDVEALVKMGFSDSDQKVIEEAYSLATSNK